MYSVAVDGVRGAVLDGHAPLDRSQAAWLLAAALGAGALAWSRLLHGLVSAGRLRAPVLTLDSALGGIVLALLGGAALVVATGGFRMFRRGGELHWAAQEDVWLSDAASRGVLGMLSGALFTGVQGGGRE
jgi:hypothetical protein